MYSLVLVKGLSMFVALSLPWTAVRLQVCCDSSFSAVSACLNYCHLLSTFNYSAPLRWNWANILYIRIEGIPKFSLYLLALRSYRCKQYIEPEMDAVGAEPNPKRRRRTDIFPKLPPSAGPQEFPGLLWWFQPTDMGWCRSGSNSLHNSSTWVVIH